MMPMHQTRVGGSARLRDLASWQTVAAVWAIALTACATTTLSPAPGDETSTGDADVAIDRIDGVSVTIETNAWTGDPAVVGAVEPIRVTISNQGSTPIRLRYADFALVDPVGRRYAALPPFHVEGSLIDPFLASGYVVIDMPRFVYRGFFVAPYYAPMYPGIPPFRRRYNFFDPMYYDFYYADLARSIRPTMEMLSLALPEGVIDVGGSVTGFLYFQRVRPGVETVNLRGTLASIGTSDAQSGGAIFGEVSIPLMVTTSR